MDDMKKEMRGLKSILHSNAGHNDDMYTKVQSFVQQTPATIDVTGMHSYSNAIF